jgi:hypothetical protein
MVDIFKDILPSILQKKNDLSIEEDFDRSYNPYIVNRALSFHNDCILQANEMNMYPGLDGDMQYRFLLNSIRGWKRPFRPWQKRETIEDLEAIREYYSYSYEKAKLALPLLSKEQIKELRKRMYKGGPK